MVKAGRRVAKPAEETVTRSGKGPAKLAKKLEEEEEEEEEEGYSAEDDSEEDVDDGSDDEDDDDDGEEGSSEEEGSEEGEEVYDSADEEEDDDDDDFEDQGSSSDESERLEEQAKDEDDDDDDILYLNSDDEVEEKKDGDKGEYEVDDSKPRVWKSLTGLARDQQIEEERKSGALAVAQYMHVDDLSSDDEAAGNTIGRVPLHWYDEYEHIGYDVHGKKIIKSKRADGVDQAIASRDDPNYYRTVYDAVNDREVVLSDRDLEIIRRIQRGAFAHPEFDAEPDLIPVFDELDIFGPAATEPKRRFLPSKWERMKIMKLVKGIKEGRIKLTGPEDETKKEAFYMLWKDEEEAEDKKRKGPMHIPAPKLPLPGHAESYNPPEEYLPTEEEKKAWEEMDPEDRPTNYLPKKFNSLREVCAYPDFIKERFERCLDLYLCPRTIRKRANVDPESLIPKLPSPKDLRPFPTTLAMKYLGHTSRVRTLAVSSDGQYMASGSDDGTLRLWEVESGFCLKSWDLGGRVVKIQWNPNPNHQIIAAAAGNSVFLVATGTAGGDAEDITKALLASGIEGGGNHATDQSAVKWEGKSGMPWDNHTDCLVLRFQAEVSYLVWHSKGDYLATLVPTGGKDAVMIHQVSKGRSQSPFKNPKGQIQALCFHPSKPFFYAATQQHVKVYHLLKQMLVKKLLSGCKWISSLDVHPTGDHVVIGSYDRRVVWFDLDLASTPYKTLKYHTQAIRQALFHRGYPLMASCSDDGNVHVFHAMVYDDLMRNPLIVPVKVLRGHQVVNDVGVMAIAFHPSQPWLFSAGADGQVLLFQDLY